MMILKVGRSVAKPRRWLRLAARSGMVISLLLGASGLIAEEQGVIQGKSGAAVAPVAGQTNPAASKAAPPLATPTAPGRDLYGDPLPAGAVARLGTVRFRHSGSMWKRIAFLPASPLFIVGGDDSPARCWNARTGSMTHEIELGDGHLLAFCVSPTGRAVATLAIAAPKEGRLFRNQLILWNAETWSERRRWEWQGGPGAFGRQLAFSPDGQLIAMCGRDGTLRLIDTTSEAVIAHPKGIAGEVESIEFSPQGDVVATASRQGTLVWKVGSDDAPQKLAGMPQGAGVVRFSPDGKLLAVGSNDDRAARLFDVQSGRQVQEIKGNRKYYSREGMCFSADGQQLIIPSSDNVLDFFDVATGKIVRSLDSQAIGPCGVAVSSHGRLLVTIGSTAAMNAWDLESGERISDRWSGPLDSASELAFTNDDRRVVTGSSDGTIRIWDAVSGRQEKLLKHDLWVAALALSPDARWLLSCGLDDTVRLWDVATGQEKLKLPGHGNVGGNHTTDVAFSPDGKRFYSFGADMFLRIHETSSGRVLAEHAIRPSGVKIEEDEDGQLNAFADPFGAGGGAFNLERALLTHDGSHLLIGGRELGKIYTFDSESGKEIDVLKFDLPLQNFLVSPDGQLLVTVEQAAPEKPAPNAPPIRTSTLRVREFGSKKVVREVTLPGWYSYVAAFSPDGKAIGLKVSRMIPGTNSGQSRVSVISAETLAETAGIDVPMNSIRQLSFSHDGRRLGTSREDSSVLLWEIDRLNENEPLTR